MIWVYAEMVDGVPRPIALELLTKARSLGDVTAIALGPGSSKAAEQLGAHGAKKVLSHEDPAFYELLAVPAVELLAGLVLKHKPELFLFGMTYEGRDIASRLSARLGTALIANASDLERKGDGFSVISPVFGGSLLVTTVPKAAAPARNPRPPPSSPISSTLRAAQTVLSLAGRRRICVSCRRRLRKRMSAPSICASTCAIFPACWPKSPATSRNPKCRSKA
jgi:electron transfer flavoprotein alpha subunit